MTRQRKASAQTVTVLVELANNSGQWLHGYAISTATGLKSGTLYPVLMRLKESGYLESRWEASPPAGRPPRHLYRITAAGLRYLAATDDDQVSTSAATR
ncbi:MAG: PadR family transcriptional regulator [Gammaproteobacteria bacterium]|nr:PadR family transcriptional regulator [Gammaproteobacteria bacterium]